MTIWTTLDIVKPSEKISVRNNESSRFIDAPLNKTLINNLIQKVPTEQHSFPIKFNTLELFRKIQTVKSRKKFYFSSNTPRDSLTIKSIQERYTPIYKSLSLKTNLFWRHSNSRGRKWVIDCAHKFIFNNNHNNHNYTVIPVNHITIMSNVQLSSEIFTGSNPLHQQMDINHTPINEKRKHNETDNDTEHAHEGPVKVHITEITSSPMETPEESSLATEAHSTDNSPVNRYTTSWKDMIETIDPLRCFPYDSLDLNPLLTSIKLSIQDADAVLIFQRRENLTFPETIARELFNNWTLTREADAYIRPDQGSVVIQFIHVLKQEILMDMYSFYKQEKDMVVGFLLPSDTSRHHWECTPTIEQYYQDATQRMAAKVEAAVTEVVAHFPQTWNTEYQKLVCVEDPVTHLADTIFADMPSLGEEVQQLSLDINSLTMSALEASKEASLPEETYRKDREPRKVGTFAEQRLLTDEEVRGCISFNTYRITNLVDSYMATKLTRFLRKDGSDTGHPDADIPLALRAHIQRCTLTDGQAGYAEYSILCGFLPLSSLEATLNELNHVYEQIGLDICTEWVSDNYATHGWAIRRHHELLCYCPGYIIKHRSRQVFGTIKRVTTLRGAIYPLTAVLKPKDKTGRNRFFFMALLDPIDLQKLQLPSMYGTLCVLRDIPFNKDKSALTSSTILSVRNVMNVFTNGNFIILPILHYHTVYVCYNPLRNGYNSEEYVHPEDLPRGNPDKLQRRLIPELLLDVIYTGTETGVCTGTDSPSFRKAQTSIRNKLQQVQADVAGTQVQLDPSSHAPIYFRCNGLGAELLPTVGDCLDIPRRNPQLKVELGLIIQHVPRGCLAGDVMTILATDEYNHPALLKVDCAVHLPSVPEAHDRPDRILLLGGRISERDIQLDSLSAHINSTSLTPTEPRLRRVVVEGLAEIHKLQIMIDQHYASQDRLLSPQPDTDPHTSKVRVSSFASNFNPPPQRGSLGGRGGRYARGGRGDPSISYAQVLRSPDATTVVSRSLSNTLSSTSLTSPQRASMISTESADSGTVTKASSTPAESESSLTTYSPAFLNQFETMIAQAVDRRSSAMQQQLDDQAGLIKEVKEQNQRLQEDLSRKEAMSNKQSIMLMASVLKMQANDIRTRIRLYNDRQNQLTRVQARVTTKKGNKADQEADLLLLEELKQGQAAERQDIARATSELRDEAQLYEVQLSMADIQDFVNRPA